MFAHAVRAALYLRISKDDAQTGLAVERQREECAKVIEANGLALVETYRDNNVSAYSRNVKRPEFDRMTADFERGMFDVVVCWDMDRFSRQPAQLERWIELGESRGLRIFTPTETTDLGTDNGRMFARMKATIARAEVERKSARQRAQTAQAKTNGTYKPRIGFDDTDAIRRMFADALAGAKVYAIGARLNAGGSTTLTGKPWSGQAVRRVLMTPRHRGTTVSEKDYDNVQALVTAGQRVGPKAKGRYSGVARCSTCGASMTASGDRYKCAYATNHPGSTGHVTVLRKALEAAVDDAMVSAFVFGRDALVPALQDVSALDVDLAKVREARSRVVGLVSKGLIEDADAEAELRGLRVQGERLEARRSEIIADNARASMVDGLVASFRPGRVDIGDVADVKMRIQDRWMTALSDDKRRELAREFLDVRIQPAGQGERVRLTHKVVTSLNEDG